MANENWNRIRNEARKHQTEIDWAQLHEQAQQLDLAATGLIEASTQYDIADVAIHLQQAINAFIRLRAAATHSRVHTVDEAFWKQFERQAQQLAHDQKTPKP